MAHLVERKIRFQEALLIWDGLLTMVTTYGGPHHLFQ